jgi:ABC-2 type transport system ATP-binding protein
VAALGSLLPETSRVAITPESDRVSLPAPDGPGTLSAALARLDAANIALADIALRRPSLDDVFLSLTGSAVSDLEADFAPGEVFS